jgi:hypothetical protein
VKPWGMTWNDVIGTSSFVVAVAICLQNLEDAKLLLGGFKLVEILLSSPVREGRERRERRGDKETEKREKETVRKREREDEREREGRRRRNIERDKEKGRQRDIEAER